MPERDSGFRFRHSLPTVAPGQNSGGAPFRQPCSAYPSASGRKAPQARFSEEVFKPQRSFEDVFLKSFRAGADTTKNALTPTASLDELAEPFEYSKGLHTSSTQDFASQPDRQDIIGRCTEESSLLHYRFSKFILSGRVSSAVRGWKRVHGKVAL